MCIALCIKKMIKRKSKVKKKMKGGDGRVSVGEKRRERKEKNKILEFRQISRGWKFFYFGYF